MTVALMGVAGVERRHQVPLGIAVQALRLEGGVGDVEALLQK